MKIAKSRLLQIIKEEISIYEQDKANPTTPITKTDDKKQTEIDPLSGKQKETSDSEAELVKNKAELKRFLFDLSKMVPTLEGLSGKEVSIVGPLIKNLMLLLKNKEATTILNKINVIVQRKAGIE